MSQGLGLKLLGAMLNCGLSWLFMDGGLESFDILTNTFTKTQKAVSIHPNRNVCVLMDATHPRQPAPVR